MAMDTELNARARHLLRTLVGRYIDQGRPVGSRNLARHSGLNLSPATVRNVMADLEDAGFIHAPHTSAGRVPTVQGYRFFVDTLVTLNPLASQTSEEIEEKLKDTHPVSHVIDEASEVLSMLTNFVGVVTVPKREGFGFRRIDFVPIDRRQLLAILVFQDGEVENRIVETDREYGASELERAANYLNREYAGSSLREIKQRLVDDLVQARQEMDELMRAAIELARSAFGPGADQDVVVAGQTRLMGYEDLSDVEKLKTLFDAFQEKREILDLLQRCVDCDGVQLFIGEESESEALQPCSLVGAPYQFQGRVVGVLGVIGPTRMAYDRVISVVDTTAKILSAVLNQTA